MQNLLSPTSGRHRPLADHTSDAVLGSSFYGSFFRSQSEKTNHRLKDEASRVSTACVVSITASARPTSAKRRRLSAPPRPAPPWSTRRRGRLAPAHPY